MNFNAMNTGGGLVGVPGNKSKLLSCYFDQQVGFIDIFLVTKENSEPF